MLKKTLKVKSKINTALLRVHYFDTEKPNLIKYLQALADYLDATALFYQCLEKLYV